MPSRVRKRYVISSAPTSFDPSRPLTSRHHVDTTTRHAIPRNSDHHHHSHFCTTQHTSLSSCNVSIPSKYINEGPPRNCTTSQGTCQSEVACVITKGCTQQNDKHQSASHRNKPSNDDRVTQAAPATASSLWANSCRTAKASLTFAAMESGASSRCSNSALSISRSIPVILPARSGCELDSKWG